MAMPYASFSPAASDHRSSPASATASLLPFCRSTPLSAGNGGGVGMMDDDAAAMNGRWPAVTARLPPFTTEQYRELEQQALIYKYLVAGVPVPPDLVLPIRRGLDSLAARFYSHPALGYGPYFGKKLDPEPGRCRRTDGKKWRCSKEAAPDSKYCERHMHRGRNRSRKPVETQLVAHPQPPSVAAAAAAVASPGAPLAAASNGNGFQSHSLYPAIAGSNGEGGGRNMPGLFGSSFGSQASQLHMDHVAAFCATVGGRTGKDLRYSAYGTRSLADEHSQPITEAINTSVENPWRRLPSQNSSFPLTSYSQLGALSDLGQNAPNSLSKGQQQPLSFFGNDFAAVDSAKQENQLRPFFDEWPKARDSWSDLTDENANLSSFSGTQLSISIPMASSDFSAASSRSTNGD
uniref:Growth-regulating factor n=1 Tax=Leersia perrieri TaxID=77586 RepID=A0A0D9VJX0_9ORYZ